MTVMKLYKRLLLILTTFLALQSRGGSITRSHRITSTATNCINYDKLYTTLSDASSQINPIKHVEPITYHRDGQNIKEIKKLNQTNRSYSLCLSSPLNHTNAVTQSGAAHDLNECLPRGICLGSHSNHRIDYPQKCVMIVMMLLFMISMRKCTKYLLFNAMMLMMASCVFGGSEYCNTAYECVGQSRPINATYTLISGGYKANSGATTDITVDWNTETKDVRCSASFSCANIGSITGSARSSSRLFCEGAFSCSNTIVNLTGNIARNCGGSNSCNGVTFNSLNSSSGTQGWMSCQGDRSCANAEFHNHHEISALGSYALYNATIHSTADGFKVKLYAPNAGFGARIFCYLGHSCTIDCYVTGCHMLYIDCVGNCDIQVNSKDTVRPITDYSLFDASQLNILYDSSALEQSNDDACLF
eukprot:885853_1